MPAPSIEIIDTQQFGLPETGAIYLLRGTALAMIESGTATSAERTLAAIRKSGRLGNLAVSPEFILLTHIHLDHAGGAGHLARAFPQVKIVVHERAVLHLMDPRDSWSTARAWRHPTSFVTMESPCPSQNTSWCQ